MFPRKLNDSTPGNLVILPENLLCGIKLVIAFFETLLAFPEKCNIVSTGVSSREEIELGGSTYL